MSHARPRVCLTFDFDAVSIWLRADGDPSATALSRGEFGARVGVPRILDLLAREEVPATFFTPGHTIDSFPDVCRRIAAEGHEVGHHGYYHLDPCSLDERALRDELDRGFDAADRVLGLRPTGYRAPGGQLPLEAIGLLAEAGFAYDSSLTGDDFAPYRLRIGDRARADAPFAAGAECDLVELPVLVSLVDVPQMEFLLHPLLPGLHANEKVYATWREEFEWMRKRSPEGVFTLVLHPSTIPRGARFGVLERLIAHLKRRNAEFLCAGDAVAAWRRDNPRR